FLGGHVAEGAAARSVRHARVAPRTGLRGHGGRGLGVVVTRASAAPQREAGDHDGDNGTNPTKSPSARRRSRLRGHRAAHRRPFRARTASRVRSQRSWSKIQSNASRRASRFSPTPAVNSRPLTCWAFPLPFVMVPPPP